MEKTPAPTPKKLRKCQNCGAMEEHMKYIYPVPITKNFPNRLRANEGVGVCLACAPEFFEAQEEQDLVIPTI